MTPKKASSVPRNRSARFERACRHVRRAVWRPCWACWLPSRPLDISWPPCATDWETRRPGVFDANGKNVAGPAPRLMDAFVPFPIPRFGVSVRSVWTGPFVQLDSAVCPAGQIGPPRVSRKPVATRRPSIARILSPGRSRYSRTRYSRSRYVPLSLLAVGLDGLSERIKSLAMRVKELLNPKGYAEGSRCSANRRSANPRARDVRRGRTE
jgi:hypothetical protein